MENKDIIETIELYKDKIPSFAFYLKKSDYLIAFKSKKRFHKSEEYQTRKHIFRRFLYKNFI